MTILRNLTIGILKFSEHDNIAAARRPSGWSWCDVSHRNQPDLLGQPFMWT